MGQDGTRWDKCPTPFGWGGTGHFPYVFLERITLALLGRGAVARCGHFGSVGDDKMDKGEQK